MCVIYYVIYILKSSFEILKTSAGMSTVDRILAIHINTLPDFPTDFYCPTKYSCTNYTVGKSFFSS